MSLRANVQSFLSSLFIFLTSLLPLFYSIPLGFFSELFFITVSKEKSLHLHSVFVQSILLIDKYIINTKSVFSYIILVSKIANFQNHSRVVDTKRSPLLLYMYTPIYTCTSIQLRAWAVYYYLNGGCLAIPLDWIVRRQFPRFFYCSMLTMGTS